MNCQTTLINKAIYICQLLHINGKFVFILVVCPISVSLTEIIRLQSNEQVNRVAKLNNEIYVLCRQSHNSPHSPVIYVFEDRNPFCLKRKIDIKQIVDPADIASSEKANCLFVFALDVTCVWKITGEADGEYKIIKWLSVDDLSVPMSVSRDGHVLMFLYLFTLKVYGSDAKLIRSVQLPEYIGNLRHAMETTGGNFIIVHESSGKTSIEEATGEKEERVGERGSRGRKKEIRWCISESTMDGQIVRGYIPSNEQLRGEVNLALYSDDQVFVADKEGGVILLDSDLKFKQIICLPKPSDEATQLVRPQTLYYDEEKNQLLIVTGWPQSSVHVYSLCQI